MDKSQPCPLDRFKLTVSTSSITIARNMPPKHANLPRDAEIPDCHDEATNTNITGLPLVQSPPQLEDDHTNLSIEALEQRLSTSLHEVQIAEVVHAYEVGIMVALECMRNDWIRRISLRHVSIAERLIFRREVRRLTRLFDDARCDVSASEARLNAKFAERDRIRVQLVLAMGCVPNPDPDDGMHGPQDCQQNLTDEKFSRMEEWRSVGLRDSTDLNQQDPVETPC